MSTRPKVSQPHRAFLEGGIAGALDYGLLAEDELVADIGVVSLVECLDRAARARLLAACLEAEVVSAELLVRAAGLSMVCGAAPIAALWSAFERAGQRASSTAPELPVRVAAPRQPIAPVRKPNRPVESPPPRGLRPTPGPTPVSDAMFVSSRRRTTSRAATEPSLAPDHDPDIAEIEVTGETEVEVPLGTKR